MFRQIRVALEDTVWQHILWRALPDQVIADWKLLTVTYGTACAPYLANRVLQQLAKDEEQRYPLGAKILLRHTYVDDMYAGADTVEDTAHAQQELISILQSAGMALDKWAANNLQLLSDASASSSEHAFEPENTVATLGLRWSPSTDEFSYNVHPPEYTRGITKRVILSEAARLYDPLGWLAPIVIRAKILIQHLWITGKDWDAIVEEETQQAWINFREQLPLLREIRISRWLGTIHTSSFELHGFSDASEKAYAATIYLVTTDGAVRQSTLLAAKSKVAPINTVCVPRLELCGAQLLAQLLVYYVKELDLVSRPIHCWSDSQVVLAWLQGHPSKWKCFIANRVSEILTSLPNTSWRHVKTQDNPADLATRGLHPDELKENHLWWHGPSWLLESPSLLSEEQIFTTTLEQRARVNVMLTQPQEDDLFARFSSWRRMLRVLSYCYRWRHGRLNLDHSQSSRELGAEEIIRTNRLIVNVVQSAAFPAELQQLRMGKTILRRSPLRTLKPFLDDSGTLRVGGRLQLALLPYQEKHPIILPGRHAVTTMLIRHAHLNTLHGGPQLTQSCLQREYWITNARSAIRAVLRPCVRCTRFQGRPQTQQMAPLPAARITPARAFASTGVDYAGPFLVRTSKGRGQRAYKGYVAAFVCLVTRAIHLEVVSDYSSAAFLQAFNRFTGRRGLPHTVYSDNGTTFRGADRELRQLFEASSQFSAEVAAAVANDRVRWQFIPPRSPHFGGLWEAAIKSFKHHLKRVLGQAKLTHEEFSTLAVTIEACLNSRPLSALSADPDDFVALTPGHFLIGAALRAPSTPPSSEEATGVSRWQQVTEMRNQFWRRWRKEVLQDLQRRSKWLQPVETLKMGDLVLITDDQQPPLHWPLARIEIVHPGPDGLVRVVTLRTASSTLTRPVQRLIVLPINDVATSALADCHSEAAIDTSPEKSVCVEDNTCMAGGESTSITAGGVA